MTCLTLKETVKSPMVERKKKKNLTDLVVRGEKYTRQVVIMNHVIHVCLIACFTSDHQTLCSLFKVILVIGALVITS